MKTEDDLETLCGWFMRRGFATGHAGTQAEFLEELDEQIDDLIKKNNVTDAMDYAIKAAEDLYSCGRLDPIRLNEKVEYIKKQYIFKRWR